MSKRSKKTLLVAILSIMLFGIPFVHLERNLGVASAQQNHDAGKLNEQERHIKDLASRFVQGFKKKWDISKPFDEMAVSDAAFRLRTSGFFGGLGFPTKLTDAMSAEELLRSFKATVNFYLVRQTYELSTTFESRETARRADDFVDFLRQSRYLSMLAPGGSNGRSPKIGTLEDIQEFNSEIEIATALLRKKIASDAFGTPIYRNNVQKMATLGEKSTYPVNLASQYGYRQDIKIFRTEIEFFSLYFVQQNDTYRLLTVGLGN